MEEGRGVSDGVSVSNTVGVSVSVGNGNGNGNGLRRQLFDSSSMVSKLLLDLTVVLTFGLATPLLAVVVAVDAGGVWVSWRVSRRRYLSMSLLFSAQQKQLQQQQCHQQELNQQYGDREREVMVSVNKEMSVSVLMSEEASGQASAGVNSGLNTIVFFAGAFWSIFVFDMVADVYSNLVGGVVVLVPAVGMPLLYWMVTYSFMHSLSYSESKFMAGEVSGSVSVSIDVVEMTSNPVLLRM